MKILNLNISSENESAIYLLKENPKLIIESLADFEIFANSQKNENQKILSVWENETNFFVKYEEGARIKEGCLKKQTEDFKDLQKNMIIEIDFRSKDYCYKLPSGKTSYGNAIKKEQLTETGFIITAFDGSKIEYILQDNQSF